MRPVLTIVLVSLCCGTAHAQRLRPNVDSTINTMISEMNFAHVNQTSNVSKTSRLSETLRHTHRPVTPKKDYLKINQQAEIQKNFFLTLSVCTTYEIVYSLSTVLHNEKSQCKQGGKKGMQWKRQYWERG